MGKVRCLSGILISINVYYTGFLLANNTGVCCPPVLKAKLSASNALILSPWWHTSAFALESS